MRERIALGDGCHPIGNESARQGRQLRALETWSQQQWRKRVTRGVIAGGLRADGREDICIGSSPQPFGYPSWDVGRATVTRVQLSGRSNMCRHL